jgi:hypothetical protein
VAVEGQALAVDGRTGQPEAREPGEQSRERDLWLEPGQGRAQAVMDAAAEGQRPVNVADTRRRSRVWSGGLSIRMLVNISRRAGRSAQSG